MEQNILTYSPDGTTLISCDKNYCEGVVIPEGITTIASNAFRKSNIISILTPSTLQIIEDGAFSQSKQLSEIVLNEGITQIGNNAFEGCSSLSSIEFPTTLLSIGNSCFEKTNLQFVYIHQNLSEIKYRAFAHTNIFFDVDVNNPNYSSEQGSLYNKSKSDLIKFFCSQRECTINQPSSLGRIRTGAFTGCQILKTIKIGDNITTIDSFPFSGCRHLEHIELSSLIMTFEGSGNCKNLKEVILPDNLEKIGACTFQNCESLKSITLPATLIDLGGWQGETFSGCYSLSEIIIPPRIKEIPKNTFLNCRNLKNVKLPEGLKSINDQAFKGCISLEVIEFPNTLEKIDYAAFSGCSSLKQVFLPASLKTVNKLSFEGCTSLEKIIIKNESTYIAPSTFTGCTALRIVSMPKFKKEYLFTKFADSPIEIIELPNQSTIDALKEFKRFESELRMASMYYHSNNMNITKIHGQLVDEKSFKAPDSSCIYTLKELYDKEQKSEFILKEDWYRASGIGLVLGWNNYHAIDVDNIHPFYGGYGWNRSFLQSLISDCLEILGLPSDYPWTVISGSGFGFHIIFRTQNIVDESIGSIAYTPNDDYCIYKECSERIFERMELRWKDHLILPPSIHKSGHKYEFLSKEYPRTSPEVVKIGKIDKLITHYCGRINFTNYTYDNKQLQVVELGKYFAEYDSWSYDPEHVEDTIAWLEQSNTPEAINSLAIKYILGNGVDPNKTKAFELLIKSKCDYAYFNLANLYACGYFKGPLQVVDYYLNKITNKSFFVKKVDGEDESTVSTTDRLNITQKNASHNLKSSKLYLFFDTETCGLPKNYKAPSSDTSNWPRLVQLSWIISDEMGNRIIAKDYIIKPQGFTIPEDSSKIHGITNEIANSLGVEITIALDDFLYDLEYVNLLIGHNIEFDQKIIGAELIRMGRNDIVSSHESFCTMKSTINFCKLRNFFGYKYPSLQDLYFKLFGAHFEDAHNSASDIEATYKCYWELKKINVI